MRSRRRAILGDLGGGGVRHNADSGTDNFCVGERCEDELSLNLVFASKLVRLKIKNAALVFNASHKSRDYISMEICTHILTVIPQGSSVPVLTNFTKGIFIYRRYVNLEF